jgi:triacylglycerol lipase
LQIGNALLKSLPSSKIIHHTTVDRPIAFESAAAKLDYCDTRYPVILVSGLGFQDQNSIINYWGRVPDFLKAHGCEVYTAYQDAFNSHVDNAIKLKYRVLDILERTGKEKINILGHSKGGIESRYMTSRLGMEMKVASLTTLGSPHQGSGIADIVVGRVPIPRIVLGRLINIYGRLMGDKRPDSLRAAVQLTRLAMENFNKDVPDVPEVYYQSYASHVNRAYPSVLWRTLAGILHSLDGNNDGLVSIESSKWGEYRGLIASEKYPSISHGDMIGLTQFGGLKEFNAHWFIAHLVHDLKSKGF